jgi:hypothetical protein
MTKMVGASVLFRINQRARDASQRLQDTTMIDPWSEEILGNFVFIHMNESQGNSDFVVKSLDHVGQLSNGYCLSLASIKGPGYSSIFFGWFVCA